jgi:hypothetical protein
VHSAGADLDDERFDAPEAVGLEILLRGLSMLGDDTQVLATVTQIFDGLYEFHRRALLLGREPAGHFGGSAPATARIRRRWC